MKQSQSLSHVVGPCRKGLALIACADPECGGWSSAWGTFSKQPTAPNLDKEEEDAEMFVKDDGWEEEVELEDEDEDDAISDVGSKHAKE